MFDIKTIDANKFPFIFRIIINFLKIEIIRFFAVGCINTLFGYLVFSSFIFIGLHYSLAAFFSVIIGVLFNFKSIGVLVFQNSNNRLIIKFIIIYTIFYCLHITGLYLLDKAGITNKYIAAAILALPLAAISFILFKTFVFKKIKP